MEEHFDVVVVGARCAGSPLATRLARQGLRVCVLDRSSFPSEVPSTHMLHPSGVASLGRLGLLDSLLATGAPPLVRGGFAVDGVHLELDPTIAARFEAPWLCVRRGTLDPLLIGAAEDSGAQVRTQTTVTGLINEDGVVRGVHTESGTLRAPLVVGADGPHSAVARFVGSREYHVTNPERFFLWAYFEGAAVQSARSDLGRHGDIGYLAMPTDDGLFMAGVSVSMLERDRYLADLEMNFAESLEQIKDLVEVLRPATRVGPIRAMTRWHGFFREATGPGWALVGDAGHFKDPTPAQGISDALRQGERLALAIESGLGSGGTTNHLQKWWRWRDEDAWEMYWLAHDMGAAGPNMSMATEMLRGLSREPDGAERFLRVLNHEIAPSHLFSTGRGLRTLIRSAGVKPKMLPRLITETRGVITDESRRRRLRRHPEFQCGSDLQQSVAHEARAR